MTLDYIQSQCQLLNEMPTNNAIQLMALIDETNILEAKIGEFAAWLQIHLTTDTVNEEYQKAYENFVTNIEPEIKKLFFHLSQKICSNTHFESLKNQSEAFPYLRGLESSIQLFREENILLQTEESMLEQQYGQIAGQMSIVYNDQEYTLQQAAKFLESDDKEVREKVYFLIQKRRLEDKNQLFELFSKLKSLRVQIARHCNFDNYRDYKFSAYGRFDYTPQDCFNFHENVKLYFLPLWNKLLLKHKTELGLDTLRPWDLDASLPHEKPLKPFESGSELIEKSKKVFAHLDSDFVQYISTMEQMQRFDLESRKNKAPGGYNCPLPETGAPFIFMNSAGTVDDLITMMHESGHAFHSFLSHDLKWNGQKEYPMEMAELASMSMELMSMEFWQEFFPNADDLKKARLKELERVISVLPWVATIDKFQHWIYTNPDATQEHMTAAWVDIHKEFSPEVIDWSELEEYRKNIWQKQLHLFEVPFYYIEYGIAQIGAIGMWQNFNENPSACIKKYKNALSKGYTQTLPELYNTAGIKFDFGAVRMKQLAQFLEAKWVEMSK